jgi:hypothetical protein
MEQSPSRKANSSSAILKNSLQFTEPECSLQCPKQPAQESVPFGGIVWGFWSSEMWVVSEVLNECSAFILKNQGFLSKRRHPHTWRRRFNHKIHISRHVEFWWRKVVPRPSSKLEDRPFQTTCDYFISLFTATLHICRLSPESKHQRTYCAIVTGDPLSTDVLGLLNY